MRRGRVLQQPLSQHRRAPLAVIVMGVSGSGKSTLGTMLADALGARFLEGDSFHDADAVAKMRSGTPLTDDDRWPWLDRIGHALDAAVAGNGIAVATCSALRRVYRDRLQAAIHAPTRFVLLDNGRDEIRRRLEQRPGHYMPPSLLDSQLAALERPAREEPAMTLCTDTTPAALVLAAIEWLDRPILER